MEDSSFYLLILVVIVVFGGFTAGLLYIKKQLRENKSIGKVIALPLIGFVVAIILLVIAFILM